MTTDAAKLAGIQCGAVFGSHRTPAVRVTFTVSRGAYCRLLRIANERGVPLAELVREALESGLWLGAILADERRQLLLRDSRHPRQLRRVVGL